MSFFCAISGEPPQNPVVSPKSGLVYERRLIVAHLNQHGTEPNGEALNEDDLIPLKASPNAAPPRPPTLTSVPALLHTLQSEWDSLMLETASLRAQYIATRQELAHALYQSDAATRVVARLVRERDEAREALANVRAATGMTGPAPTASEDGAAEDVDMAPSGGSLEPEPLPEDVLQAIDNTHATLSAARKKRKTPSVPSPARLAQEPTSTYPSQGGPTNAFALAPRISATAFLTGGEDGVIRVWDGGKVLAELTGHSGRITALEMFATSEGDAYIVSGSEDRSTRLWSGSAPYDQVATSSVHSGAITGLAAHPSGQLLLAASQDGSFSLLRLPSLELVSRALPADAAAAQAGGYASAALHPDGVLLALGLASAGKIQIFDIRTRALAAEFDMPTGSAVASLSFSENGYSLASAATGAQEVVVWDLRKLQIQRTLPTSSPVRSVAYDAVGAFIAAAGESSVEAFAHKGWNKVWEGVVGEQGLVRWGSGAGQGSVWVGGKTGVAVWQPQEE